MDFAKHGECVQREDFLKMMRMLKQWPDFFEKTHKPMRESVGILGKLYRDLSNEKSFREYMQNQYKYQVQMQWEIEPRLL